MEYNKIKCNGFNLHIIKSQKFKTITVKINFKNKMNKNDITYRNMLINILLSSTKKFSTKRLMEIETENLYGIYYGASNYMSGVYNVLSFDINFINELYTEKDMNIKSLDFLLELIFNPNILNNEFMEKDFKLAYNSLHDNIISIKENTSLYSNVRMLENIEDSVISYRGCGYLEDLDKISPKSLFEYYQKVINEDIVDIFVLGDIDNKFIDYIKNKINLKTRRNFNTNHFYKHELVRSEVNEVIEEFNSSQSKLVMGFKLIDLTDFELRYVLNIYNYILGGSPDSKLFKNIREKESLCYSISSNNQPLIGIFSIHAGINQEDYLKTRNLIDKEIKDMKNGCFSENDIKNGIITYINSLEELKDSPNSIISLYTGCEYLNSETIEKRVENIKKVTKEDIMNLASKIKLDTVYLLKGINNED